jgi:hypothetical protein
MNYTVYIPKEPEMHVCCLIDKYKTIIYIWDICYHSMAVPIGVHPPQEWTDTKITNAMLCRNFKKGPSFNDLDSFKQWWMENYFTDLL